jgi:predicted SnoaL-like aldol condensation-catalyzing enzyme
VGPLLYGEISRVGLGGIVPKIRVQWRFAAIVVIAAAALAGQPTVGTTTNASDQESSEFAMSTTNCSLGRTQLERNKRNVVGFYTTAFNDHDPELAVRRYGGDEYIQHNPLAANGFDAFIDFVNTFTASFPDLNIDIRRVFADCDFVITHAIVSGAEPVFGERGNKAVDIFRVDRRGKIVEHWDVLAPISATSANGNPEV